jgi:hypothetical protein
MCASVDERALGATLGNEEREDDGIWNKPLRSISRRFVNRKVCKSGNKFGEETTRGKIGRLVELGATGGRVGSEMQ